MIYYLLSTVFAVVFVTIDAQHDCSKFRCPKSNEKTNGVNNNYLQMSKKELSGITFNFNVNLLGNGEYICVDLIQCTTVNANQGGKSTLYTRFTSTNPKHWIADLAIAFYGTDQVFGGCQEQRIDPRCHCGNTLLGTYGDQYKKPNNGGGAVVQVNASFNPVLNSGFTAICLVNTCGSGTCPDSNNFQGTFVISNLQCEATLAPQILPLNFPVAVPTPPTERPTTTSPSTSAPSQYPSQSPSIVPSNKPTIAPSQSPSQSPSIVPSNKPTIAPSKSPSQSPSIVPSIVPSNDPSIAPSQSPSPSPSIVPSNKPTIDPSKSPSQSPSNDPTIAPSKSPSQSPSIVPSNDPTIAPSKSPSQSPSIVSSNDPTIAPSKSPSQSPSIVPSNDPTIAPSESPSILPSFLPTAITFPNCPSNGHLTCQWKFCCSCDWSSQPGSDFEQGSLMTSSAVDSESVPEFDYFYYVVFASVASGSLLTLLIQASLYCCTRKAYAVTAADRSEYLPIIDRE